MRQLFNDSLSRFIDHFHHRVTLNANLKNIVLPHCEIQINFIKSAYFLHEFRCFYDFLYLFLWNSSQKAKMHIAIMIIGKFFILLRIILYNFIDRWLDRLDQINNIWHGVSFTEPVESLNLINISGLHQIELAAKTRD